MKTAVFAYTKRGCETAKRVRDALGENTRLFTVDRLKSEDFDPIPSPARAFYGELFRVCDALVFIGACGIAVREIAPFVRDKRTDPAVVAVDELSRFVVPLLSGHIGGANELAVKLAEKLGAVPVVTTATDVNGRFSVDAWAEKQGFIIGDMKAAKAVSAAILEREVPLCCEFPVKTPLPAGVYGGESGDIGIYIGWEKREPFKTTLRLIPPALHLGIGCRKGTEAEAIEKAVASALSKGNLDRRAVRSVASIDLKAKEAGLLAFCEKNHYPARFFTAEELAAVPGDFHASDFVRTVTGVDNVCERAALMEADRLLIGKTAQGGVTVAVAAEDVEVRFE